MGGKKGKWQKNIAASVFFAEKWRSLHFILHRAQRLEPVVWAGDLELQWILPDLGPTQPTPLLLLPPATSNVT